MRTLVVFYSQGGETRWTAEQVARRLSAEMLELDPAKAYPQKGFAKFFHGGRDATFGAAPALKPYAFDGAAYDRIVFGTPVWAGSYAPPLRTFIEENRAALSGKRFAAFACQMGSGAEKAFARLKKTLNAESLDGTLALISPLKKPDHANAERLDAFCAALERI